MAKITLYVDIVSPFAYMGYYTLRHNPAFRTVQVNYVPIFLGGLMKACNNAPPLSIKNKAAWIALERLRWAETLNIPMVKEPAKGFPIMTVAVMRALCYVQLNHPDKLTTCLDALYESHWVKGNGLAGKPEGFGPVLEQALGKEMAEEVIKGAGSPEAKKQLNENTDKAFSDGAFGLPWFQCENKKGDVEGFWGVDHLGQVIRFLGLDKGNDAGLRALL